MCTFKFNKYLFEINILAELHVLGVDAENLQSAGWVRNTNIDFTVEATEATKGRVDGVGTVGRGHDDDVGASLEAIHEGQEL